ncbi:hypothetical protein QCA50_012808 [Cerrena zonata]|uniref:ABC-2 type transporter transmembrane domain-containing protein n=1 Tax=Cerrena zonata TaxID=2478898 RepID=A0AAW0FT02_9APHY
MLGVLVLLSSLLFAGLFINSEDLRSEIKWLQWISIFHYAYEALAINEVKDLILKEKKYGLSIEVPGAVILSTFGFDTSAFWKDTKNELLMSIISLIKKTGMKQSIQLESAVRGNETGQNDTEAVSDSQDLGQDQVDDKPKMTINNPPRNKYRVAALCVYVFACGYTDAAPGALLPFIENLDVKCSRILNSRCSGK